MKLFKKNKETSEVTAKEDKTPWWIALLAEIFFFFLLAYTKSKKDQEEKRLGYK